MSQAQNGNCGCPTPVAIFVPGTDGVSCFTYTTASFVVPAVNGYYTVSCQSTDMFVVGEGVVIGNDSTSVFYGNFSVSAIDPGLTITVQYIGGGTVGATVLAGSKITSSGQPGQPAYTSTFGSFLVAGSGSGNLINSGFISTAWMVPGQAIIIYDTVSGKFGTFQVSSISSSSSASIYWLGYSSDTITIGSSLPTFSKVACSGKTLSIGSLPTLIIDSSGGIAAATIPATVGEFTLAFFMNLVDISAAAQISSLVLGYGYKILSLKFVVSKAATTAAKSATLNLQINGASTTGGVLSLTSANCTPKGNVVSATAITPPTNTGLSTDGLTLVCTALPASFVEGSGWFVIEIQNTDDAAAFASLAAAVNQIITAL